MKWQPHPILILFMAIIMMMCLGSLYSWSVFVSPIKTMTGLDQGPVQFPFNLFYICFPLTLVAAGTFVLKWGPRVCAIAGGCFFGAGWFMAGFGDKYFIFTTLGIGILAGIGVGLAYIVPISVAIQWFPRHKGLVTGIAVAGFGGGAALVANIADTLMKTQGVTPFEVFKLIGFFYFLTILLAGTAMVNPPDIVKNPPLPLPPKTFLSDKFFKILYFAMFTGLMAGFTVNANMKELFRGTDPQAGVMAVSLFAIANALGRITWGFIFDRMGSSNSIKANLLFQALLLFASPWLLNSTSGFQFFAFFAGFNYGGVLVLYASSTAKRWSPERVSQIYGWMFSSNIFASFAPTLAGYIFDRTGTFTLPLLILAIFLLLSTSLFHLSSKQNN